MVRFFAKDDSTGVRGHSTRRRRSKGQERLFPRSPEGAGDSLLRSG